MIPDEPAIITDEFELPVRSLSQKAYQSDPGAELVSIA